MREELASFVFWEMGFLYLKSKFASKSNRSQALVCGFVSDVNENCQHNAKNQKMVAFSGDKIILSVCFKRPLFWRAHMALTRLFIIKGAVTAGFGLVLSIAPDVVFNLLGTSLDKGAAVFVRLFGLLSLGVGVGLLLDSGAREIDSRSALGNAVFDSVAALILIVAGVSGTFNALSFGLAAIYIGSAALYTLVASAEADDTA